MSWLNGLSREEIEEMFLDACAAYNIGVIGSVEFTMTLVKLGYNATDIKELERDHRPRPAEDEGD